MLKTIISLLSIILFFSGCEKKDDFQKIIQKLKDQNQTKVKIAKQPKIKQETKLVKADKNTTKKETKLKQVKVKEVLVNKEKEKKKEKITSLTLKTPNNKEIHLKFLDDGIIFDEYKNKVVVLDIFTTWCPPCIESIPHINQIQKLFKKDLQVIGILMEEDKRDSEVLQFIKKHNINYPITNSKENFVLTKTWGGISGYPTIIIFDKNGTYFNHYNGSPPLEMLESDIKKALRKK